MWSYYDSVRHCKRMNDTRAKFSPGPAVASTTFTKAEYEKLGPSTESSGWLVYPNVDYFHRKLSPANLKKASRQLPTKDRLQGACACTFFSVCA